VGAGGRQLELLYDALVADVMASAKIFADETPIPTLEPGRGKTKKAYLSASFSTARNPQKSAVWSGSWIRSADQVRGPRKRGLWTRPPLVALLRSRRHRETLAARKNRRTGADVPDLVAVVACSGRSVENGRAGGCCGTRKLSQSHGQAGACAVVHALDRGFRAFPSGTGTSTQAR
jgi:hypothetical protein